METPIIWLFLFIALAIGWWLGRYDRGNHATQGKETSLSSPVKNRLQLLFDSYSDSAIDKMLHSLEVSAETFDTHISIGKHFRRQGEVEKAILVHQNLMSHPELSQKNSEIVIFELAKDYKAAGLFDRAVALLEQLSESKSYQYESLVQLLSIREKEKDWPNAVSVANRIELKRFPELRLKVAHYLCELAEEKLNESLVRESEVLFKQALQTDKSCIRSMIGLANIDIYRRDYAQAIRYLKQVGEISPENICLTFDLLLECTKETDSFNAYLAYLDGLYEKTRQTIVLSATANALALIEGQEEALQYLKAKFVESPSMSIMRYIMELNAGHDFDWAELSTEVMEVVQSLDDRYNTFLCGSCGFQSTQLLWQCPSCNGWQTHKPVLEYQKR